MGTHRAVLKRAPRLLIVLTIFTALFLSSVAPLVSAASTAYHAATIQTWLEDQYPAPPWMWTNATVSLSSGAGDLNYMQLTASLSRCGRDGRTESSQVDVRRLDQCGRKCRTGFV